MNRKLIHSPAAKPHHCEFCDDPLLRLAAEQAMWATARLLAAHGPATLDASTARPERHR